MVAVAGTRHHEFRRRIEPDDVGAIAPRLATRRALDRRPCRGDHKQLVLPQSVQQHVLLQGVERLDAADVRILEPGHPAACLDVGVGVSIRHTGGESSAERRLANPHLPDDRDVDHARVSRNLREGR